jgi:probable rRNA maturation factor
MIVGIENRQKYIKLNHRQIRRDVRTILKTLQIRDKELSLVFVDNREIQEINRDYLGRDWPTNVVSFAFSEGQFSNINPKLLGDIIISVERAMTDAKEGDLPFEDALDYLIIHGLLHLLGYDHEGCSQSNAQLMKEKEQEVFCAIKGYCLDLE